MNNQTHRSQRLSRREFLATTAVATAGLVAGCRTPPPPPMKDCIDAHVHVWTPDTASYPIDSSFTKADMVPPSFTPDEFLAHAKPNGVSRAVLVQMSFYKYDNRYLLESLQKYPGVFSGIGIVDENAPRVQDRMAALAKQGVRGFRIAPGKQDVNTWLNSPGMLTMWKVGTDLNLAMCPLVNADALPAIERMSERVPQTRVVIDHCARIGVDGQIREKDVATLCGLARFPNTYVKVSAFYALGQKKAPYADLGPMIQYLRDAYSAGRLMWASDCPYQVQDGHNYADSINLIRDGLKFLTPVEKEWMLRKTAERVFF